MQTIIYILPELFLSSAIMMLLIIGVFVKKSFKLVNFLTILVLFFSAVLVINQPEEIVKIFNESYIIDRLSIIMKVLTFLFSLFVLSEILIWKLSLVSIQKPQSLSSYP